MRKIAAFYSLRHYSGRENFGGVLDFLNRRLDWDIHVFDVRTDLTPAHVRRMVRNGTDGVLLSEAGGRAAMAALAGTGLPVALVNIPDDAIPAHFPRSVRVWTDDFNLGATAARYLLSRGNFNAFGFIHKKDVTFWSRKRAAGFAAELARHRRDVREFDLEGDTAATRRALAEWIRALPKPAALMAATDRRAAQAIGLCLKAGVSVPNQVAVIGVDNDESYATRTVPQLTSVKPNLRELGYRSAKALAGLMERRIRPGAEILVGANEVVERESAASALPAATLIRRAKQFIALRHSEGIGVADVVAHLGCSRRLADLRFRQIEGCTIRDALERERMQHARAMLGDTTRTVRQVAARCGFSSANLLTHLFKRRYGQTIRDWREGEAAGAAIDAARTGVD